MNAIHGKCSLYLCPAQHNYSAPDTERLTSALQDIGLISQPVNNVINKTTTRLATELHFLTGEKFLDYIAYLGCAPAIQFEADETGKNFCFIKIHRYDSARLIHSKIQPRAPHCPVCKKATSNWQHNTTSSQILCDQCHTSSGIEMFNWRKMAGYAQLFIEITDIFPKEAMPQQMLLDKLSDITGTEWQHFYSCQ